MEVEMVMRSWVQVQKREALPLSTKSSTAQTQHCHVLGTDEVWKAWRG